MLHRSRLAMLSAFAFASARSSSGKTARQATFDCRFDQVGREERERDRHVDLPDTASFARGRVQPYSLLPGRPFR
jgi:hypothetical protein